MAKDDKRSGMNLNEEANDVLDSMRDFIAENPEFEVVELIAVAMRDDGEVFVQEFSAVHPHDRKKLLDRLRDNIEDEDIAKIGH